MCCFHWVFWVFFAPPLFFFDSILGSRLATRNPKEHELAKTVEPPICSESVAGDTQKSSSAWELALLRFTRSKVPGISLLLYIPPLKINMSPKMGPHPKKTFHLPTTIFQETC